MGDGRWEKGEGEGEKGKMSLTLSAKGHDKQLIKR